MSIFRKRSGSQSSFSHVVDEISVSKIQPDFMIREGRADTIQSTRSSCSDVDASDFAIHESCAVRNFPKHKSSHLRFLAWVAYTRKYTDEWITDIERRTCPLLFCREQFPDQDSMLKHVWNCPHLSKGLYWCFHCQKPERVGKFQCKRCQGVPSRTDRMASVAKKIFSKLGSKANRHDHYAHSEGGRSWANFQTGESSKSDQKVTKSYDDNNAMDWNPEYIQELPNTSICPEMPGDWAAASHELPDTYISEMIGTEIPIEMGLSEMDMGAESWNDNFYSASLEDWEMPPPPVPKAKNSSPKPATLRVDTSFSSLTASMYQGRIPQRTNSENWPETPLSPTIISPLSAGPVFSATSLEISPTDSDTSGNSFFTDSGYSSATTTISAWNMPTICEQTSAFEDKRGKKRAREEDEPVFEDWIHESAFSGHTMMATEVATAKPNVHQGFELSHALNAFQEVALSSPPNVCQDLTLSPNHECVPSPRIFTAHWCDAPTLVHSFSEALDAHIEHTKSALRELPSTSITQELLAMSKTSMVSIGLEVLAGILEGRRPTAIVQVFAFTHIACAFVIATEHDEGKVISDAWFGDILSWVHDLASVKQRGLYGQIVKAIWKPFNSSHIEEQQSQLQRSSFSSSSSSSSSRQNVQSENALFSGCKQFLDVLGSYGASDDKPAGYMADISLVKHLLPEESYSDDEESQEHNQAPFLHVQDEEALFDLGFDNTDLYGSGDEASLANFMREADSVLQNSLSRNSSSSSSYNSHASQNSISRHTSNASSQSQHHSQPTISHQTVPQQQFMPSHVPVQQSMERTPSYQNRPNHQNHQNLSTPSLRLTKPSPPQPPNASLPALPLNASSSISRTQTPSQDPKTLPRPMIQNKTTSQSSAPPTPSTTAPSSNSATCPLCPYIPTGEDRWKASNLRRHKRTQHPELSSSGKTKMYPCRFPGCESTFRRSDNLRGHQRDKGHGFLGVGVVVGVGMQEREQEADLIEGTGMCERTRDNGDRGGKKRRMEIGMQMSSGSGSGSGRDMGKRMEER